MQYGLLFLTLEPTNWRAEKVYVRQNYIAIKYRPVLNHDIIRAANLPMKSRGSKNTCVHAGYRFRHDRANIFALSGGYTGVIDTKFKQAVALFRVTGAGNGTNVNRDVHMILWNADGSQIIIANLAGKLLERIDVERNSSGTINTINFNKTATLSVGKRLNPEFEATVLSIVSIKAIYYLLCQLCFGLGWFV
jgi:hypothetical protein